MNINRSILLIALLLVACSKKITASHEFGDATKDVRNELATFRTTYPQLEAAIIPLRASNPSAAAAKLEAEVLPMLDRIVAAMQRAHETGTKYVELATDEDPKVIAKIRDNVTSIEKMRTAFAKVRTLYAEEAGLLKKGPVPESKSLRIAQGIVDAMRVVVASK